MSMTPESEAKTSECGSALTLTCQSVSYLALRLNIVFVVNRGEIMAMTECPECKTEVSSEAKTCPKCGFKIKKFPFGMVIGIPIALVSAFLLFGASIPANEANGNAFYKPCYELVERGAVTMYECQQAEASIRRGETPEKPILKALATQTKTK